MYSRLSDADIVAADFRCEERDGVLGIQPQFLKPVPIFANRFKWRPFYPLIKGSVFVRGWFLRGRRLKNADRQVRRIQSDDNANEQKVADGEFHGAGELFQDLLGQSAKALKHFA